MIDMEKMTTELKRDEGFRSCVYKCTAGKQTVGYGHNLEDNPMPELVAEQLLKHDIAHCLSQCEQWPWFYTLNDARQRVIVNMVFNIGANGVSKFSSMIQAISEQDYEWAADEMIDSRWYNQVGDRAKRLVEMMRNG